MAKEAANNLVETSDYIGHHLVNLTFGWCEKTSSWGFAHHQQDLSKSLDSACDVSEMGFWAFHMDTIFMSIFLGVLVFGFFGLINRSAKKRNSRQASKLC
jgi:F-type H+-transporting ATPase subunit a